MLTRETLFKLEAALGHSCLPSRCSRALRRALGPASTSARMTTLLLAQSCCVCEGAYILFATAPLSSPNAQAMYAQRATAALVAGGGGDAASCCYFFCYVHVLLILGRPETASLTLSTSGLSYQQRKDLPRGPTPAVRSPPQVPVASTTLPTGVTVCSAEAAGEANSGGRGRYAPQESAGKTSQSRRGGISNGRGGLRGV